MKRWCLLAISAVALGCTPTFDDPSLVKDLRVLAVVADPPEILVDLTTLSAPGATLPAIPTITFTPLVVDPAGAGRAVSYRVEACGNDPGQAQSDDGVGAGRVRDTIAEAPCPSDALAVSQGSAVPASDGTVPITVAFTPTLELLTAAVKADPLSLQLGLPITLSFTVQAGDEEVVAIKRVIISPRLSADQIPNGNPQIVELLARHTRQDPQEVLDPALTASRPVALRDVLRLLPSGAIAEAYDARSFSSTQRTFVTEHVDHETLRFAFYATRGTFSPRVTSTNPSLLRDDPTIDLESIYQAPSQLPPSGDPLVEIFVVTRDERGGASFVHRRLRLQ